MTFSICLHLQCWLSWHPVAYTLLLLTLSKSTVFVPSLSHSVKPYLTVCRHHQLPRISLTKSVKRVTVSPNSALIRSGSTQGLSLNRQLEPVWKDFSAPAPRKKVLWSSSVEHEEIVPLLSISNIYCPQFSPFKRISRLWKNELAKKL